MDNVTAKSADTFLDILSTEDLSPKVKNLAIDGLCNFLNNYKFSKRNDDDLRLANKLSRYLKNAVYGSDQMKGLLYRSVVSFDDIFEPDETIRFIIDNINKGSIEKVLAFLELIETKELLDANITKFLVQLLAEIDNDRVKVAIIELLDDKIKNTDVINVLEKCTKSNDTKVVQAAIYALASVVNTKESRAVARQLIYDEKDVDRLRTLACGLIRKEEES